MAPQCSGATDAALDRGGPVQGFVEPRDFVWSIGSLARIHAKPFDAALLIDQFPAPHTLADIVAALDELGFAADFGHLGDEPAEGTPCLVFREPQHDREGAEQSDEAGPPDEIPESWEPAILVRKDAERVLLFSSGSNTPQTMARADFDAQYGGWRVSCVPQPDAPPDDELDRAPRKFGFRWFIPELLRYKSIWRDVLLASLAIQVMALATPVFTQVIIDKVIVNHTMNTLYVVAFGLFAFMLFSAIMSWVRQYLVLHTGNRIDAVLGAKAFSHLFALPLRYFEYRSTGTLVARMQGIETIREFVSGAAVTLILDFPFLFVFVGVMFYYSWQLTTIVLVILSVIALLSIAVAPTLRKRLNEQFQLGARNQAFMTEHISGAETVKSLQLEPQLGRRFGDYLASYLNASFRARTLSNTYSVAANTLEQFQVLAILGVGAWLVMTTDGFTIGMLVAFQMFASRLSQPLLRLVGLWLEFQQAQIAVKRLGDIMDAPPEPYAIAPSREVGGKGRIQVTGLSFRYRDDSPYLYRDLNLTLEPGTMTAVMGPSGSGKSTLAKLLQGFYQPTEGGIQIDGRDIRHLSANELRSYFGVVPQETVLFSGTIYANLLAANPQASFEQVIQACKMAEIHETIEQLPKGYQTEIGEHGTGLSGGQKQRLAIARALLKRPKVLVFDEVTSHLDQATAERFASTVNRLKDKVTILFVTHHLPKGLNVDSAVMLGHLKVRSAEPQSRINESA